MAKVLRLPPRESRPALERQPKPAPVVDLTRMRDFFNAAGLRATAEQINALPNPRDVEAAIETVIRDFKRIARVHHCAKGEPVAGAAVAIRAALRAQINRMRRKEIGDGGDRE